MNGKSAEGQKDQCRENMVPLILLLLKYFISLFIIQGLSFKVAGLLYWLSFASRFCLKAFNEF